MKLIALALIAGFALSGTAFARGKARKAPTNDCCAATQQHNPVLGWDDSASSKKIYNWPDHRYYGQHGMMLD